MFFPPPLSPQHLTAIQCAATEARRYGMSEEAFKKSIVSIESRVETYKRALFKGERREILLELSPGGTKNLQPLPQPQALDPWKVDPHTLEATSRVSCICPTCTGSTYITCNRCHGSGRVKCGRCGGSGRVLASKKGQWSKNCPQCRGKGDARCGSCSNGKVACTSCSKTGRVTAWLSCQISPLVLVTVHPTNTGTEVHDGIREPSDFNRPPGLFRNRLVEEQGVVGPPRSDHAILAPPISQVTDRIHSYLVQSFAADVHHITCETSSGASTVFVAGNPPSVSPTSDWSALKRRRTTCRLISAAFWVVLIWLFLRYVTLHPWYATYGHGFAALLCSAVMAVSAAAVWRQNTLVPLARARTSHRVGRWTLGVSTALTVALYSLSGPSLEGAQAALSRGDLKQAGLESDALVALNIDPEGGRSLRDPIQMIELQRATEKADIEKVMKIWSQRWNDAQAELQAGTMSFDCIDRAVKDALISTDPAPSKHLISRLEKAPPVLTSVLATRLELLRARQCLLTGKLACTADHLQAAAPSVLAESLREEALKALDETVRAELKRARSIANLEARRKAHTDALKLAKVGRKLTGIKPHPLEQLVWRQMQSLGMTQAMAEAKTQEELEAKEAPGDAPQSVPSPVPGPVQEVQNPDPLVAAPATEESSGGAVATTPAAKSEPNEKKGRQMRRRSKATP